jgi:tetratricopeptide (TPR) repeat protein
VPSSERPFVSRISSVGNRDISTGPPNESATRRRRGSRAFISPRGDVLARLGRGDEAEREFRSEISEFPADPRAYASLVMLLATQHKLDAATKVVFDLLQASPGPHSYVLIAETLKTIGDDRGALFWTYQGLRKYPADAELRGLPRRLADATRLLQSRVN